MPGSPTAALPQVRADRAHLDTAGAQKQDRGLRRAKAATATSIKKLFKGRRTTPEAAPCEQHRPIESRPSSVHSGRSVRSIFSSARRITLRPSMLFRHQEPEAGTASAELEHPRPDTPRPPPSPPPSPPPTAHPQRHSPLDSCRDGGLSNQQRQQTPRLPPAWPLPILGQSLCVAGHALPSVPHTPPASCSSGMAGSPSSYSSRSLGLDLLDFGYDSHVVDGLLPASPGGSPTTSGSGRSLLASSALSPDEPPDPDCAAGCPPADPHLSQADLVAPIDLVDFTSLGDDNGGNDDDNDGCASVASHRQDTPHPGGTGAADQLVVDDIDELLAELDLVSAHGGCMVGLGLSFGFGGTTDDDSFSLSEIDALLESLDKDAGAFPAVYPALVVRALGDVGRIVSAAMTPEQPVVDAAEPVVWPSPAALVARLGRCPLDMGPADSRNEQAQEGAIPDVLASLGGAYTPDYILYSVECADGGGSGCAPVGDAPRRFAEAVAHGRCYAQFHCKLSPESSASPAETTAGCLDVDEGTAQGPRSRASSIHSFDQPFENAQSIAKLMAALRVQPIVVSRPFVGPSRTVVLPRLC